MREPRGRDGQTGDNIVTCLSGINCTKRCDGHGHKNLVFIRCLGHDDGLFSRVKRQCRLSLMALFKMSDGQTRPAFMHRSAEFDGSLFQGTKDFRTGGREVALRRGTPRAECMAVLGVSAE